MKWNVVPGKKRAPLSRNDLLRAFLEDKEKISSLPKSFYGENFLRRKEWREGPIKEIIIHLTHYLFSDWPKKCRTSTFQKSFFIRTTRIWNLLITRLDLDNVTFENFKSVLYGYYSRALAINYDPDSPRSFKSICLKCNTARFLDQEISCYMWLKLLILYLFIFWVRSNWL